MTTGSGGAWHHATAVVVGESGVLIRGPSGSGKSMLARRLVADATGVGLFAALVGDDRVALRATGGRLMATGHPTLTGLLEVRGTGLVRVPSEPSAIVRLVVDCGTAPARLPEPDDLLTTIEGVRLPRLAVERPDGEAIGDIRWRLRVQDVTGATVP